MLSDLASNTDKKIPLDAGFFIKKQQVAA